MDAPRTLLIALFTVLLPWAAAGEARAQNAPARESSRTAGKRIATPPSSERSSPRGRELPLLAQNAPQQAPPAGDVPRGTEPPAGAEPPPAGGLGTPEEPDAAGPAATPAGAPPPAPQETAATEVPGDPGAAPGEADTPLPGDIQIVPTPGRLDIRVDITPGDIPVEEFVRFIADVKQRTVRTFKAAVFSGGAPGVARQAQTITITAPIQNADYEIVKLILEQNGYDVYSRTLVGADGAEGTSDDEEVIIVEAATAAAAIGQDVKPKPVIGVTRDGVDIVEPGLTSDLGIPQDELATMVFTLENVAPADAITSLNTLATGTTPRPNTARGTGFSVAEVKGTQTLIVTAKFGLLDYILKLLKIIDVAQKTRERMVHIIEAKEADVQDLVSIIDEFLAQRVRTETPTGQPAPRAAGGATTPAAVRSSRRGANEYETILIPDARTQKIIVTTYYPEDLEDIYMLVRELDTRFDIRRLKTQIYRMRYLKAIDVAQVLMDLLGSAGGRSGIAGLGTSARSRQRTRGRATLTPSAATPRATTPGAGATAQQGLLPANIVPHEETNSLIIQAEPEEYAEILHILQQIDVKRRQVFLEAALVQVNQQSSLNYTIELLAGDPDDRATRLLFEQSFGLSGINTEDFNRVFDLTEPPAGGILAIMDRGKFPFLISFLKGETDAEVLATPFILADDNVQSTINITETRFFLTTSTINTATTTSTQGEEAGITLDILPTINSENSVFLEVGLEVSEFASIETGNVLPPKTTNAVTSSVTVAGDRIYVIGGLTRENRAKAVQKIPIIGDIPLLGKLFRSESTSSSVTNLYVFLRAHILTDEHFGDLAELTDQAVHDVKQFGTEVAPRFESDPPRPDEVEIDRDDPRVIRPLGPDRETDAIRRDAERAIREYRDTRYQGDREGIEAHGLAEGPGAPGVRPRPEDMPEVLEPLGPVDPVTPTPPEPAAFPERDPWLADPGESRAAPPVERPQETATAPPPVKRNIPESWRRRGLELDPESPSWFVPLKLDLRRKVTSEEAPR